MEPELAALSGASLPPWLYEYGVALATAAGVAYSAIAGALFRSRGRAQSVLAVGACAMALFLAGYVASKPIDSATFVEGARVVAIFLSMVGGSFVHSAYQATGWRAIFSLPAIVLYGVAGFTLLVRSPHLAGGDAHSAGLVRATHGGGFSRHAEPDA